MVLPLYYPTLLSFEGIHPLSHHFYPTTLSYDFTTMDLDQVDDIIFLLLLDSSDDEPQPKRRVRTGQLGDEYLKELLDSGHPERILNVLCIQLATFNTLYD